jgi:hypothetical protein
VRSWIRFFSGILAGAMLLAGAVGCNQGFGAYSLGVGNTPNKPPGTSFRVLGDVGTRFSAVIYDATSTWTVQGVVPQDVIVVNATLPIKMIVTKQAPGNQLLSVELTVGFRVIEAASTSAPFGTATVQTDAVHPGFAPPPPAANPDIRFFVKGPMNERFSGMVEDTQQGYVINDRAPALFLFDQPVGKVDGVFTQIQNFGPFVIDLIINGQVVASATGGPTLSIKQP